MIEWLQTDDAILRLSLMIAVAALTFMVWKWWRVWEELQRVRLLHDRAERSFDECRDRLTNVRLAADGKLKAR